MKNAESHPKARDERSRAECWFEQVLEAAPDAMVIVGQGGEILVVNQQTEHVFGYRRDELIGQSIEKLVPVRFRELHQKQRDGYFSAPKYRPMRSGLDLLGMRRDGSEFPAEISLSPIADPAGAVVACAIRDVTERKRAEQLLRERQEELAHVTRVSTAGEMATGLAHELNQPLYSIANYARGCINRLDSSSIDPKEVREIAEEIEAEAQRAAEIIRRLRRMVQKRGPIQTVIDINRTVNDACSLAQGDLGHHSVRLDRDLDQSLPTTRGDDIQLQQVILNLLRNAAEAMRHTSIHTRVVRVVTRYIDRHTAQVSVVDAGAGIAREDIERVFDAFHTTSRSGMGMGLAISRSIVESQCGRIWATNNADCGATLHFTLPIRADEDHES
ncbi:MAG: nitrogen regulation protein NR(II) [Pirellulaceae bacterium]